MNRRTLFETRRQLFLKNWIRRKKLFSLHYTRNSYLHYFCLVLNKDISVTSKNTIKECNQVVINNTFRARNRPNKMKQETLRVAAIALISSTLALLWKFQCFRRPIYNPIEHLWLSFYSKNSKPLSIFTKKLHRRYSLGF